jgi:predicted CoA-substrate-specific enzyme activase
MTVSIGVDVGASFTKICVMTPDSAILRLDTVRTPIMQKEYFTDLSARLRQQYGDIAITSCGYGQRNINHNHTVSELTALAWGIHYAAPNYQTVLDIGGQDAKVISCVNGKVTAFALNDQCAAGCGLFFLNALSILNTCFVDVSLQDITCAPLSAVCAVFAQTEIVRRVSAGESAQVIIDAAAATIMRQATRLLGKIHVYEPIAFTGGLSLVSGAAQMISHMLGMQVAVPPYYRTYRRLAARCWESVMAEFLLTKRLTLYKMSQELFTALTRSMNRTHTSKTHKAINAITI